ncbi:DNA-binding protein [Methylobacterium sp. J-070]|uniref:DNA-binding protein n=1 Tax=Methylobacterium sp. J-070 TaxID=2836650 RepID=UPI001FB9E704|nr:DNA-binding protein [Methylobacterium sp. J-070]MCJ2050263.1 DNA-binding protein [Methylobacterium sp. J-070]
MPSKRTGASMVDVARVWEIADEQRAAKAGAVTVRSVWRGLGSKGSFEDLAPMVAAWKAKKDYRPTVELSGLPETLQKRLIDFGASVLEMVRAEEAAAVDVERGNIEAERRAYREVAAEASATVDRLEARVAELQAEVAFLRNLLGTEEVTRGIPSDRQVEDTLPLATGAGPVLEDPSDAFWASVSVEVQAILAERGPMSADALLSALPEAIRKSAVRVGPPITQGMLSHRLRHPATGGMGSTVKEGLFLPQVAGGTAWVAEEPSSLEAEPSSGRNVEGTAFWRRVMIEISGILERTGPLTARGIVDLLSPETVAEARRFEEIRPGKLAEKMRVRIKAGKHFVEVGEGRFGLLGAGKAILRIRPPLA